MRGGWGLARSLPETRGGMATMLIRPLLGRADALTIFQKL